MENPEVVVLEPGPSPYIGWTVQEYLGMEIYRTPEGLTGDELREFTNWPEGWRPAPITEPTIESGTFVVAWGGLWKVHHDKEGAPYLVSGKLHGILEFGADSRKCWVCVGTFNPESIMKLFLDPR